MRNGNHRQQSPDFSPKTEVLDRLADRHARGFVGRTNGLAADEHEDTKQELLLALYQAIDKYDPSRGTLAAFLDRVLRNRTAEMARRRNAAKRDWRRNGPSLQHPLRGRDASEPIDSPLSDLIDAREARAHTGRNERQSEEAAALKLDMDTLKSKLQPDLRKLADLLESESISAAAEQLGESCRQVRKKREMLLEIFTSGDLEKYL
ncbi:sigma-70 family RNA polymerase sigma factor [Symmachiella dynata]|uniref:sigma-70 family RNA polymerase sigma factor n=1 Tax=Symmachiella dynata TaxID=2527995 RepID=UPI0030EED925